MNVFCEMESGSLVKAEDMLAQLARGEAGLAEPIWRHLLLAWLSIRLGKHAPAARRIRAALRLYADGPVWLESVLRSWLATALHYLEEYKSARAESKRALQAAEAVGWHERILTLRINLAIALLETGSTQASLRLLSSLQKRHEIERCLPMLAGVLSTTAQVLNNKVAMGSGAWANKQALLLSLEEGLWQRSMYNHESEAWRASVSGRRDVAAFHRREVVRLAEKQGESLVAANTLRQHARRSWVDGETARALSLFDQAVGVFTKLDQPSRRGDIRCDLSMCHLERGLFEQATAEINLARQDYAAQRWSRERGFVDMLELEGFMRRSPETVSEAQINGLRVIEEATTTQLAYAYAVMALGFALINDDLTTREMSRTAVGLVNDLREPFLTHHILNLAHGLRKGSSRADEVLSYWLQTFLHSDSPDTGEHNAH